MSPEAGTLGRGSLAGVEQESGRLLDEARRRELWLRASTEITRQLLSTEGEDPLRVIALRLQHLADADAVNVVIPVPGGQQLNVEVATGAGSTELSGASYSIDNTVSATVLATGRPVLLGPLMVLPLVAGDRVRGALVVGRLKGREPFLPADLDMGTTFANHAAVALELADARAAHERIALLEDRNRIARDLHDNVMQRLFGAGMTVESVSVGLGDDPRSARLSRVVQEINDTITQIRTSIFQLRGPLGPASGAVRAQLLRICADATAQLAFDPDVRFMGPVEALVPEPVLADLCAVLREALSNVARHAGADHVRVLVSASPAEISLRVEDDGSGMGRSTRRSGLANLLTRAEQHGGTLVLGPAELLSTKARDGGTTLLWTIPLR